MLLALVMQRVVLGLGSNRCTSLYGCHSAAVAGVDSGVLDLAFHYEFCYPGGVSVDFNCCM
jgi:hypothetical protein